MSTFPTHIFRAYDIRGLAGDEITVELAQSIGVVMVRFLREETGKSQPLKLVVGRDMRLSSPEFHAAVVRGMTSEGAKVIDIGLCSAPTFYFGVTDLGADGGVMVSASHNPKEWNGFKLVRKNAVPISGQSGMDRIREMCRQSVPLLSKEGPGEVSKEIPPLNLPLRKGERQAVENILDEELKWVLSQTDTSELPKLKVVADAANAMGAPYLRSLFEKLDCELIEMNFELDGTFPAHEADPFKDENVVDLQKRIVEEGADFGIATDGDADRIFFFDETGARVEPQVVRAILSENVLREYPGAKICYDIRPGRITQEKIEEAGGKAIVTRVGHSLIKETSIKEGAKFAGESSGHMFFWYKDGFFEIPMLATVKFLEEIGRSSKKVSEMADPYRKYFHSGEINLDVRDTKKVLDALAEKYIDSCLSRIDGVTFEYPNWWANVRASNTEEKVRLNMEAVNEEMLKEKLSEVRALIEKNK
jgi:phosphomannomutase